MYVSWNLVAKGQVIIHHQGGSEDFFRGGSVNEDKEGIQKTDCQ